MFKKGVVMFHIHFWTKWQKFIKNVEEWIPPMTKNNWYAKTITHRIPMQKRHCKICGKIQEKKI